MSIFNYLFDNLNRKKYYRISQTIPHVGNKHAKYISGGVIIKLTSMHMRHKVLLSYKTESYSNVKSTNILADKLKQRSHEESLL